MANPQEVAFFEGGKVLFYGRKKVKELDDDVAAQMVQLLSKSGTGMNGAQLAKELSVTPPSITKAAKRLLRLGIIRRESLPVSQNVKLYSLTVKVLNESDFDEIRKSAPPTLLKIMTQNLAGNEKMALFYVRELQEYLKSLPESERGSVVTKIVEEVTGHEIKD
jgi:DNA-binding Lrp family transcriptional regulator